MKWSGWTMRVAALLGALVVGCGGDDGGSSPDGGGAAARGGESGSGGQGDRSDAQVPPTDSGTAEPDGGGGAGTVAFEPIDPPVADDCITDVAPGDHTFTCSELTFLVMVDEMCTRYACGLIFDVHGGTMSGRQMRDNTQLHELAPPRGYLVVHPSATPENTNGTWDLAADPPKLADFMFRMIDAFHVDMSRIHVTGFSQGSGMTFWFLCNHNDLLASTAPISGASASQVTVEGTGAPCLEAIDASWEPRVPILFMSGIRDTALTIDAARERIDGLVTRLSLTGGDEVAGDGHYSRKRWQDGTGMVLDYLEHDYGGQAVLDGHCVPGGIDLMGAPNNFGVNATTCTDGEIDLHWGEVALQWFLDHPKR